MTLRSSPLGSSSESSSSSASILLFFRARALLLPLSMYFGCCGSCGGEGGRSGRAERVCFGVARGCRSEEGEFERLLDLVEANVALSGAELFADQRSSLPGSIAVGIFTPFFTGFGAVLDLAETDGEKLGALSFAEEPFDEAETSQSIPSSECSENGESALDLDLFKLLSLPEEGPNPNPKSPFAFADFDLVRPCSFVCAVPLETGCAAGGAASSKRTLNCFFPARGLAGVSSITASPRRTGPSSSLKSAASKCSAGCTGSVSATRGRFSLTGEGETSSPRRRLRARVTAFLSCVRTALDEEAADGGCSVAFVKEADRLRCGV